MLDYDNVMNTVYNIRNFGYILDHWHPESRTYINNHCPWLQ